ncbi:dual specificity protein kinase yak1 [Gonapodya sp. JEL0774]|nr:dual specificity protein kinase yak1 [Gonapodya sp. JEL0774]
MCVGCSEWRQTYWDSILLVSQLLKGLTQDIVPVYRSINPAFSYQTKANPRRVLTKPSKPCHNDGFDNEDSDYILYVNDLIGTQEGQRYQILDILGQGTFGQVVRCQNVKTRELVAVKVIKNKPAYYNQSLVEVAILEMLNNQYDPHDKHHTVRMLDTFVFRNHLCICFEMLSVNLYELTKQNGFRGLSTNLVRVFVSQILDALTVLSRAKIIHCDLKPENILLRNLESPGIKVIDFGSACHENQTVYTYIQSRFYRSPEVILGLPYTSSIDMWSLGCIAAELFLGLPLFPGSSEYNQISRIVEMIGVPPPYMIEKAKQAHTFFEKRLQLDGKPIYALKSMDQYSKENNTSEHHSKRYFQGTTLVEVISHYPGNRKGISQKDIEKGHNRALTPLTGTLPFSSARGPSGYADAMEKGIYGVAFPTRDDSVSHGSNHSLASRDFDHFDPRGSHFQTIHVDNPQVSQAQTHNSFASYDNARPLHSTPRTQPYLIDPFQSQGHAVSSKNPPSLPLEPKPFGLRETTLFEENRGRDEDVFDPSMTLPHYIALTRRQSNQASHADFRYYPSETETRPPVPDPGGEAELIPGKRHSLPHLTLPIGNRQSSSYTTSLVHAHSSTYINGRVE